MHATLESVSGLSQPPICRRIIFRDTYCMPSTSRKRRSTARMYAPIDRPRQTHFTPRNRTVAPRPQSVPTPKARQQTLTQIDYVFRVPAGEEGNDLDYIMENAPRSRKRQKTIPAVLSVPKAKARKTESPKQKAAGNDMSDEGGAIAKGEQGETSIQTEPQITTNVVMFLPKTPRKIIKTEIPSSQSPATTPLSVQTRRSTRNKSRSPLKDKSTNISYTPSVRARNVKKISWTPRLEVQDTFGNENEATRATYQVQRSDSTLTDGVSEHHCAYSNPLGGGFTIPTSRSNSGRCPSQELAAATCEKPPNQHREKIKVEVQDSASEGEDNNLEDDGYNGGADTQAALDPAEMLVALSSNEPSLHLDPVEEQADSTLTDRKSTNGPHEADDATYMTFTVDTPRPNHRLRKLYTARHTPRATSPRPISCTPTQYSPTDEPSAQLYADVDRSTQPLRVQLQTPLLEKASRPISPPKITHNTYTTRSQRTQMQTHAQTQATQNHQSALIHPLSSPGSAVPLSQATTTDVTQGSPLTTRTQLPLSSQLPIPSQVQQTPPSSQPESQTGKLPLVPSSQGLQTQPLPDAKAPAQSPSALATLPPMNTAVLPSSQNLPPRQPSITPKPSRDPQPAIRVFSSSPLDAEGSSQVSPLWDGRPLTDSQLLPDSLMDMTIPPPPMWSQESLEEE